MSRNQPVPRLPQVNIRTGQAREWCNLTLGMGCAGILQSLEFSMGAGNGLWYYFLGFLVISVFQYIAKPYSQQSHPYTSTFLRLSFRASGSDVQQLVSTF